MQVTFVFRNPPFSAHVFRIEVEKSQPGKIKTVTGWRPVTWKEKTWDPWISRKVFVGDRPQKKEWTILDEVVSWLNDNM